VKQVKFEDGKVVFWSCK